MSHIQHCCKQLTTKFNAECVTVKQVVTKCFSRSVCRKKLLNVSKIFVFDQWFIIILQYIPQWEIFAKWNEISQHVLVKENL